MGLAVEKANRHADRVDPVCISADIARIVAISTGTIVRLVDILMEGIKGSRNPLGTPQRYEMHNVHSRQAYRRHHPRVTLVQTSSFRYDIDEWPIC